MSSDGGNGPPSRFDSGFVAARLEGFPPWSAEEQLVEDLVLLDQHGIRLLDWGAHLLAFAVAGLRIQ
jgi:hypothetical protein